MMIKTKQALRYQSKALSKVASKFFENYLTEFSTNLIIDCLMPSDKHT